MAKPCQEFEVAVKLSHNFFMLNTLPPSLSIAQSLARLLDCRSDGLIGNYYCVGMDSSTLSYTDARADCVTRYGENATVLSIKSADEWSAILEFITE